MNNQEIIEVEEFEKEIEIENESIAFYGSTDYEDLSNLPSINDIKLKGNKTLDDLGIQAKGDYIQDLNYVHTDNNYTDQEKNKLATLQNYDDSEIRNEINSIDNEIEQININKANKSEIPTIPTNVSAFTNDSGYLTEHQDISGKQDKLVSGTNIKTINNQSILGNGNIEIQGGSGGTSDYTELLNKPKINNVELNGNKTLQDLGINNFSGDYNDLSNQPSIPSKTSDLENDSNFISEIPNTYVKNTDYMKWNKGGVAKVNPFYAVTIDDIGNITSQVYTNEQFNTKGDEAFVSKGTLANVLSSKDYANHDDLSTKQDTLTPGENITIENNIISAVGGSGGSKQYVAIWRTTEFGDAQNEHNQQTYIEYINDYLKNYAILDKKDSDGFSNYHPYISASYIPYSTTFSKFRIIVNTNYVEFRFRYMVFEDDRIYSSTAGNRVYFEYVEHKAFVKRSEFDDGNITEVYNSNSLQTKGVYPEVWSSTYRMFMGQQPYLGTQNTVAYNPTLPYHPSTKKYVDDLVGNINEVLATLTSVGGE